MSLQQANHGKKKIVLALQGGGAHTAYAWGVVERLLQQDEIEIAAVSGTSGGALIAAVLAHGLSGDGDDAARRAQAGLLLERFWRKVAALGDAFGNPYRSFGPLPYRGWNLDGTPVPLLLNTLSVWLSPYQSWGGPRQNPVAQALADCIDFAALNRSTRGPALYVCATNVRTGQQKIFDKQELRVEHLLASACLPMVDRAVEIDGEAYWDGGYVADPALSPLIRYHRATTTDLVVVGVNPIVAAAGARPDTAWAILDRLNEITFNASLIAEIKRIQDINQLLAQVPADASAKQPGGKLHRKEPVRIHYIAPHAQMAQLGVVSKNNTALPFLQYLRQLGHDVADAWCAGKTDGGGAPLLGKSSDTNLESVFIMPHYANAPTLPCAVPDAAGGWRVPASVAV